MNNSKILKVIGYILIAISPVAIFLVFFILTSYGVSLVTADASVDNPTTNTVYYLTNSGTVGNFNYSGSLSSDQQYSNGVVVYDSNTTYTYLHWWQRSNNQRYVTFSNSYSDYSGVGYFQQYSVSSSKPTSDGWYRVNSDFSTMTRLDSDLHTLEFLVTASLTYNGQTTYLLDVLGPVLNSIDHYSQWTVTFEPISYYGATSTMLSDNLGRISFDGDTTIDYYLNGALVASQHFTFVDSNLSSIIVPPHIEYDSIRYYYDDYDDWVIVDTYPTVSGSLLYWIDSNNTIFNNFVLGTGQYDSGYLAGYQAGYADNNNLLGLMWHVFDFPFRLAFGEWSDTSQSYQHGLFTFTILGLDVRPFVLSLMAIIIIVAIVRFILGRR